MDRKQESQINQRLCPDINIGKCPELPYFYPSRTYFMSVGMATLKCKV